MDAPDLPNNTPPQGMQSSGGMTSSGGMKSSGGMTSSTGAKSSVGGEPDHPSGHKFVAYVSKQKQKEIDAREEKLNAITPITDIQFSAGQGIIHRHKEHATLEILFPKVEQQGLVTSPLLPFTPLNKSVGATLKVGFVSGTVNGIYPTLGGIALNNATPPTQTITVTTWFWLKCVGTFGSPDTYVVTIESNTTGATPSGTTITDTGFTSFIALSTAVVASGAITSLVQLVRSNLGVESYGSVNFWWDQ